MTFIGGKNRRIRSGGSYSCDPSVQDRPRSMDLDLPTRMIIETTNVALSRGTPARSVSVRHGHRRSIQVDDRRGRAAR